MQRVERGASALRRLVPPALGKGLKLPFMSVRLSSIRKFSVVPVHCRGAVRPAAHCGEPPSGPALPGLGGVYLFLPSLSPEAKEGGSRLFDGRHLLCPCRDRESRSRSSTIFEARGPRLIKRSLPIASARRRTRAMMIFLRKCTTGAPQVDRSVDKLTAFVSVGERTRRGVRAARPLSSQLGTVARTPTNLSVAAHRRHDYAGVVICVRRYEPPSKFTRRHLPQEARRQGSCAMGSARPKSWRSGDAERCRE